MPICIFRKLNFRKLKGMNLQSSLIKAFQQFLLNIARWSILGQDGWVLDRGEMGFLW